MHYKVVEPLKFGHKHYAPGSFVEMDEKDAKPLLALPVPPIKAAEKKADKDPDKKLNGSVKG